MFPALPYGITPDLHGLSRHLVTLRAATLRPRWRWDVLAWPPPQRLSAGACWSTAMAATSRRVRSRSNSWRSIPRCGIRFHNWWSAPRTCARVQQHRSRSPRTPPGWRTSPGPDSPELAQPQDSASRWSTWTGCGSMGPERCPAPVSATAISAACYPTPGRGHARRSGRWRSAETRDLAAKDGLGVSRATRILDLGRRRHRRQPRAAF